MDKSPVYSLYRRLGPNLVKPDMYFLQAPGYKTLRANSSNVNSFYAVEPKVTQIINKPTEEYKSSSLSVADRLIKTGNIYQRRNLELRQQKIKQERDIITSIHKPTVKKGQSSANIRLFQLSKQKAMKLDQRRREQDKRLASVNSAPKINSRSQEIANQKYKGMKVEDRLLQAGLNRESLYAKQAHMSEIGVKAVSQPVLTKHAQSLQREGKVEDRLIKYQQIYTQKVDTIRKSAQSEYTFKPKINENWEICPPLELPGDSFDKSPGRERSNTEELTFKPKILPYSRKLVSKSRSRLSHSRTMSTRSCHTEIEEFTFKPKINHRSSRVASSQSNSVNSTWERLYKLDGEQKAKLEEKRREIETLNYNDIDCTFSPKILARSPFQSNPVEIAYRLNSWLLKRDNKVKQAQEETVSQAAEECTFKPVVKKSVYYKEDNLQHKKGVQNFFKRQEISRKMKAGELPSYSEFGSPSYTSIWKSSTRFSERESDADLLDEIERLMNDSSSDRLS